MTSEYRWHWLGHLGWLRNLLILIALWEVVGRLKLIASGALPAPSAILVGLYLDQADYPAHIWATLQAAVLGFFIGNSAAVLAGILFVISPLALRLARGINIAIFSLPPIAIVPVLVLTFSGMTARVVLSALGCYFATMTATVLGLSQADPRSMDVVRAYGGNSWTIMRLVQLRSALPSILGGLRIAAPNAVLGAILAEFGGGGRWGLGTYLLGSLGRADPPRLWGIGLVATAVAGLAYALFAIVGHRITGATRAVTIPASAAPTSTDEKNRTLLTRALLVMASILLPLLIWWLLLKAMGVPTLIAKTPLGVIDYLFLANSATAAQLKLLEAFSQTLPITILGLFAGLAVAFLLAILSETFPAIARTLLPVALVTQTMPLVALTPLLVLLLGRGTAVTLWITISVTFFPSFVTIAQGLILVSKAALDVPRAYGATKAKELQLVAVPASLPYLFAALRLAVPRALLGVMIAEWLATGKGLGNLLNQSRGYLDYGMIWTVAAASVLLSVLLYQLVVFAERRLLGTLGMKTSE
jgi:ABC-type nitrate/sulfonate/bicarbonate transport system permease component